MQAITMFSKDYCPYGKAAKSLLRERGLPFNEIEVGNNPELLAYMIDISGSHSVPQISLEKNTSAVTPSWPTTFLICPNSVHELP